MYIDYDNFDEMCNALDSIGGREYSPGWISRVYGVSRQAVQQWIKNDVIDAHRCKGDGGYYLYIKEKEFEKIDVYRNSSGYSKRYMK